MQDILRCSPAELSIADDRMVGGSIPAGEALRDSDWQIRSWSRIGHRSPLGAVDQTGRSIGWLAARLYRLPGPGNLDGLAPAGTLARCLALTPALKESKMRIDVQTDGRGVPSRGMIVDAFTRAAEEATAGQTTILVACCGVQVSVPPHADIGLMLFEWSVAFSQRATELGLMPAVTTWEKLIDNLGVTNEELSGALDQATPFVGEVEWVQPGAHYSTSESKMILSFAQMLAVALKHCNVPRARVIVMLMLREAIHRGPGAPGYEVYQSLTTELLDLGIPSTRPPWD